ncbi:unnamed protein product, partial [Rotaria sordida]
PIAGRYDKTRSLRHNVNMTAPIIIFVSLFLLANFYVKDSR